MISLILATGFFVGIHLFISGTSLRTRLVERLGEKLYMALFAVLSLIGLVWMIRAYGSAPYVELWGQVMTARGLASLLILLAFLLMVPGILTPNPTAVGAESLLQKEEPAKGILRITRHPFLIGVALWAATHMIYNGDLGSAVFFGGFLLLSVFGPRSIDAKLRLGFGDDWQRFAGKTSIIPFMAIIEKRNTLNIRELLTWRLLVALAVYIAMFELHAWLFGVPAVLSGQ